MVIQRGEKIGRFLVEEVLGRGGMGEVYKAFDTRLERNVALKVLHADALGSLPDSNGVNAAARMLREARAVAALQHPNIVALFDIGEVEEPPELAGTTFLAMELVRGRTLRACIGDEATSERQKIHWLADVARALGAAHAHGLVHRDIKPENVMIRDDGVAKVLDFGVAKRARPSVSSSAPTQTPSTHEGQVLTLTGEGVVVGTPYYMAPEQMRGEPLDGRTDQFSWGVVAYELLSGRPPWTRDTDALQLVAQVLSKDPDPLERACPALPAQVARVVMRAMAKSPNERYPTMDALVAALEEGSSAAFPRRDLHADDAMPFAKTESQPAASIPRPEVGGSALSSKAKLAKSRSIALAVTAAAVCAGIGWALATRSAAPPRPEEKPLAQGLGSVPIAPAPSAPSAFADPPPAPSPSAERSALAAHPPSTPPSARRIPTLGATAASSNTTSHVMTEAGVPSARPAGSSVPPGSDPLRDQH
jgi:serine/threonine-protein kinase